MNNPQYIVQKAFISTPSGTEKAAWNVIDLQDGFIVDTFCLKRDAVAWIRQQTLKGNDNVPSN